MVPIKEKDINGKKIPVYPDHLYLYLAATDSKVGVNSIKYSINGGSEKVYSNFLKDFTKGHISIKIKAFDNLGNQTSEIKEFYIE